MKWVKLQEGTRLTIRYRDAGEWVEGTRFTAHEDHTLMPTADADEAIGLLEEADGLLDAMGKCNCEHEGLHVSVECRLCQWFGQMDAFLARVKP